MSDSRPPGQEAGTYEQIKNLIEERQLRLSLLPLTDLSNTAVSARHISECHVISSQDNVMGLWCTPPEFSFLPLSKVLISLPQGKRPSNVFPSLHHSWEFPQTFSLLISLSLCPGILQREILYLLLYPTADQKLLGDSWPCLSQLPPSMPSTQGVKYWVNICRMNEE